jgi:hypothetical protein
MRQTLIDQVSMWEWCGPSTCCVVYNKVRSSTNKQNGRATNRAHHLGVHRNWFWNTNHGDIIRCEKCDVYIEILYIQNVCVCVCVCANVCCDRWNAVTQSLASHLTLNTGWSQINWAFVLSVIHKHGHKQWKNVRYTSVLLQWSFRTTNRQTCTM